MAWAGHRSLAWLQHWMATVTGALLCLKLRNLMPLEEMSWSWLAFKYMYECLKACWDRDVVAVNSPMRKNTWNARRYLALSNVRRKTEAMVDDRDLTRSSSICGVIGRRMFAVYLRFLYPCKHFFTTKQWAGSGNKRTLWMKHLPIPWKAESDKK